MTSAISNQTLSPAAQCQHLFDSVGIFFNSLCESADSAFRRVDAMKKDENGNIKLYSVKNQTTEVAGEEKKTAILTYIEDVKTGEMTLDEPAYVIATKCALIVLGMPFYTLGKMSWFAFKTPVEITTLVMNTLARAGQQFVLQRFYEGFKELRDGLSPIPEAIGSNLFEIIKAPVFGLGATLAGIYGVVKPFHGRKMEAIIEYAWQNGASFKNDFRNIPPRTGENCWEAFAKDMLEVRPFYLAHCFQIRGNTRDPRIVVIRRSPL